MEIIDKNTVSAENQLSVSQYVQIHYPQNNGMRIMFIGNSITLHGISPKIGWHHEHGMAASCREKDYVHIVESAVLKKHIDATFCICQVAFWENNYKSGTEHLHLYESARDFEPDVIIMRAVENCPRDNHNSDLFKKQYGALIDYLNKNGKAKIIITDSFWPHIADKDIKEYADEKGYPFVALSDLPSDQSTMAFGLFEHDGVAHHPSDKGMALSAKRIINCLDSNGVI